MPNTITPPSLRPRTLDFQFTTYRRTGRLRFLSPLHVEVEVRRQEHRVEYDIHAVLTRQSKDDQVWAVQTLRGARVDRAGGLSRAADRDIRRDLPHTVYSYINAMRPGAIEQVEAEQLLMDPEGYGRVIQKIDQLIEELPPKTE